MFDLLLEVWFERKMYLRRLLNSFFPQGPGEYQLHLDSQSA